MQADCPGGSLTKEDCGILLRKLLLTPCICSTGKFLFNGSSAEPGKMGRCRLWPGLLSHPCSKEQTVMELMTNNLINLTPLTACACFHRAHHGVFGY